jgi:cell division septum initiation protein DivIVA
MSAEKGAGMDLIERIEELQVLLEDAKAVPLSGNVVVNRDEMLELLAQLKHEVPDEIREARWVARDRDELLSKARSRAEQIVADADERRERLLARSEILKEAEQRAAEILSEARREAHKLEAQATDYIDGKLAGFETLLKKTLGSVARGRDQLRPEAAPAGPESSAPPGERPPGPFNVENLQEPLTG